MKFSETMNNQPSNYDLAIGFLQVFDLLLNVSQSTNDDILRELQHQNNDYLSKIISQNEEILQNQEKILKRLGSK